MRKYSREVKRSCGTLTEDDELRVTPLAFSLLCVCLFSFFVLLLFFLSCIETVIVKLRQFLCHFGGGFYF